ncbi:hypothetical protein D9M68_843220 [compost metagenome]
MAQINSQQLIPKRLENIVLDAMTGHQHLSLEVLVNVIKNRAFAMVIYKVLMQQSGELPPI